MSKAATTSTKESVTKSKKPVEKVVDNLPSNPQIEKTLDKAIKELETAKTEVEGLVNISSSFLTLLDPVANVVPLCCNRMRQA